MKKQLAETQTQLTQAQAEIAALRAVVEAAKAAMYESEALRSHPDSYDEFCAARTVFYAACAKLNDATCPLCGDAGEMWIQDTGGPCKVVCGCPAGAKTPTRKIEE